MIIGIEGLNGFSRAKTMSKKNGKNAFKKSGTNSIGFNPGTFVIETQGVLNSNYDFLCKLGEGILIFTKRNIWNSI